MIIYANVTTTGPFAIHTILLYCNNGTDTVSYEMYRYGDYPVQSRHEEDPFTEFNQTLPFLVLNSVSSPPVRQLCFG